MSITESRVIAVIATYLGVAVVAVKPESSLADDLGADSLDHVELLMGIEDEFDIEIPDEKIDELKTVKDVIDYVVSQEGVF